MVQTPLVSLPQTSDLVAKEWDQRHCREDIDVSAYDHSAATNLPLSLLGWTVDSSDVLIVAATAANADAVIVTQDKLKYPADGGLDSIENENADKFQKLIRGPAIIKEAQLNLLDAASAAITLATLKTALLAKGITVLPNPVVSETQSAH